MSSNLPALGTQTLVGFPKDLDKWMRGVDRLLRDDPVVASLSPLSGANAPAAPAAYSQAQIQALVDAVNEARTMVNAIVAALAQPIGS